MTVQTLTIFSIWKPGYGGATVVVYVAGSTTLASLYSDPGLVTAIANPQTLSSYLFGGVCYGKWAQPVYVAGPVTIEIDAEHDTGVLYPPLTDLDGVDASGATVITDGTPTVARSLAVRFADEITAEDYGEIGASASTNAATITAALGDAANGGEIKLPPRTFPFTQLTLPANCVLRGGGKGATIMQSVLGDKSVMIGGDDAGFRHLTLDGVSVTPASVGIYAVAKRVVYDHFAVRRFVNGIYHKGGVNNRWFAFDIDGCTIGAKLHGDNDVGDTGNGSHWSHNSWFGGIVKENTSSGVDLEYIDVDCEANDMHGIGFIDNVAIGLKSVGVQNFDGYAIDFDGNGTSFTISDEATVDYNPDNQTRGWRLHGGRIDNGNLTFTGRCEGVVFNGTRIHAVAATLTAPQNTIQLVDCVESATTLSGSILRWARRYSAANAQVSGVTTDATPTVAYSHTVEPGEIALVNVRAVAVQWSDEAWAVYERRAGVRRQGAELAYDAQTANFTLGANLTGGTSGATAVVAADADAGASGTLTIKDVIGTFQNNESLTDDLGGAALVNGTISYQAADLLLASTDVATAETIAGWECAIVANATGFDVVVTGAAGDAVRWEVNVQITQPPPVD